VGPPTISSKIQGGPPTLSPIALLSTNIAENGPKRKDMLKDAKNHEKRANIGLNGVFGHFLDVFVIPMTKKCTKTNIFATGSVINQGIPHPFAENPGGTPTLCPPLSC
jgi:hypothetical protein